MTPQTRLNDEQREELEQLWNDSSQMNKRQFISCIESIVYPDESKPLQT